jgi:ThiF family
MSPDAALKSPEAALARTTSLINEEYFGGSADPGAITSGLLATTVCLFADEKNASSRAGQAALVTAFQLIARMGIGIELNVPDVPLKLSLPPLNAPTLNAALVDLGADLIPGVEVRQAATSAGTAFAFGDSASSDHQGGRVISVEASDFGCRVLPAGGSARRIESDAALGGLAAGAAVAALALDRALENIEAAAGTARTSQPRPSPGPPVDIDLRKIFPKLGRMRRSLPRLDVISGGAVTNCFLYVMLWLRVQCEQVEICDDDDVDWHNLNRCTQFRASDVASPKAFALERCATDSLRIWGRRERFEKPAAGNQPTLADDVVVGVDRIEARWWVQQAWPRNLYVAATSNREAVVTTHHRSGACAGCAHPEAAPPRDEIPTISFVSFWAGLIQACALLTEEASSSPRRLTVFPFALGESAWSSAADLRPTARCAIGCAASGQV